MAEDVFNKTIDELIDKAIPKYLNDLTDETNDKKGIRKFCSKKVRKGNDYKKVITQVNLPQKSKKYKIADEHIFSERHNDMMKNLFENIAQKEKRKKYRCLSRVAAIVMLCTAGFSFMFFTNSFAIKDKIKSLLLKDKNWFSVIENKKDLEANVWKYNGQEIDIFPFTYLPLKFGIKCFEENEFFKRIDVLKGQEYIRIKLAKMEKSKFDTEDVEATYLNINNIPIMYFEKDGKKNFIFNYEEMYAITLKGNADYDTFIKIIEKME